MPQALDKNRKLLGEFESKELLKKASIPVVETRLARTRKEAIELARQIGFPVALKIASPDIAHKSDAGGVKLGLTGITRVGQAYTRIKEEVSARFPRARIEGVTVQRMARPGIEVIMGMSQDAQFGPVIMFGLGGIMVEILKDVSFRIAPVTRRDAAAMIREIKGYPVLEGYRGREPADIPALEELIVKVSDFCEKHSEIAELDLNPVFAYRDGVVAVDARIVLEAGQKE